MPHVVWLATASTRWRKHQHDNRFALFDGSRLASADLEFVNKSLQSCGSTAWSAGFDEHKRDRRFVWADGSFGFWSLQELRNIHLYTLPLGMPA